MGTTRIRPVKQPPQINNGATPIPENGADATTLPLAVGHRFRYDKATGEMHYTPLRLADLLDPTENADGVFFMAEGPAHDLIATLLATQLRTFAKRRGWLILRDVRVDWEQQSLKPQYPDITAIFGGRLPEEPHETYKVGRDGGTPEFLIEITSKETRQVDLKAKPLLYAAAGVKELLIIDLHTPRKQGWKVLSYQLSPLPPYTQSITPDAEGGVTMSTLGLRFVAVGRERIDVYDATTGKRLLTPDEVQAQAEELERRLRAAEAIIQKLTGQKSANGASDEGATS